MTALLRYPVMLRCTPSSSADAGARRAEPVRAGVPWSRGTLLDARQLIALDQHDKVQPLQACGLDRWPDGSIRWILLDWLSTAGADIRVGAVTRRIPKPLSPLRVNFSRREQALTVDTGQACFHMQKGGLFPFEKVTRKGIAIIDSKRTRFEVSDESGRLFPLRVWKLVVEEAGPLRIHVSFKGKIKFDFESLLECHGSVQFFADSATVRFDIALTNPRRAKHARGIWTLGQRGSVYLSDASFVVAWPAQVRNTSLRCSPELGANLETLPLPFELYQDSSGGKNWKSRNHLNRNQHVPSDFRGYSVRAGSSKKNGLRATPIVWIRNTLGEFGITMQHYWQNFPKAIEANDDSLRLRLFPRQYADVHELQGGEQKTHTFYVAFGSDTVSETPMTWCRSPMIGHAEPEYYAATNAIPYFIAQREDPHSYYLDLVAQSIDGSESFEKKREVVDEFGWRHFGDLYADHENAYASEPKPIISHYNNQYDAIKGFAVHFMRSGDPRWFNMMDELTRHVIDIDIYHTDGDKSAYNRGMFWHTDHYITAHTSTHRSYPALPGVRGGGPSCGHLYTTGLMLHYCLTGHTASRKAVLELGQYVIDSDDGKKTPLRFLYAGFTGAASASDQGRYHGPGRNAGNSLNALLDAHQLDGNLDFSRKADQLIRRCIHPEHNVDAQHLWDVEHRWFYMIFLHSLIKYLDIKVERDELDNMYRYARASLLHYLRWAADNEYPYLEKPELLEYPTETWAAQELRKADVFDCGARYADDHDREKFLNRANFFFEYALETLPCIPTHTYCRPMVLALNHGYVHGYIRQRGVAQAPTVESSRFGPPQHFVPQKKRALRRLMYIAGLALIIALGTLVHG